MPPLLLGPLWTHGDSFCSEVRLGIFVCFRGFWRIRGRVDWLVSWWYEGRESLWRDTAPGISKVQRGTREWPWKARFCLETIIFRWSMSNLSGGKGRSRKDIGLTRKMWRSRQWWQPGNSAGALFGIVKFKGWNGDLQRWEIKRSRLDIIHRWHNLDSPLIVVPIPTTKSTFQAFFLPISPKKWTPLHPPVPSQRELQFSVALWHVLWEHLFDPWIFAPCISNSPLLKQDAGHEHTNIGVYGFTKTVFSYERKGLPPNNPNKPTKKTLTWYILKQVSHFVKSPILSFRNHLHFGGGGACWKQGFF